MALYSPLPPAPLAVINRAFSKLIADNALLLSLLTVMGTMTTPAFAAEDLVPGGPGALTERYIDESTSRELAPPTTSKSSWVKDAPAIEGYEFESFF